MEPNKEKTKEKKNEPVKKTGLIKRCFSWCKKNRRPVLASVIIIIAGILGYLSSIKQKVVVGNDNNTPAALLNSTLGTEKLKRDDDARINILVMGKGGANHDGGNLTDTIELVSLDIFSNQVAMLSIPRDLYVKTKDGSLKINAVYSNANGQEKDSGGAAMKDLVSQMTDLNIHYFVTVDFTGFVNFIDSIGGIDINVKQAINDPEYPKDDGSNQTEVFYLPAGQQHLNGETALKFVRSRHSTSDFDRSARQQQVIAAIKEKSVKNGLLSNPVKFIKVLSLIGDSIKTDIPASEMKLLAEKIADIDTEQAKTAVLSNSPEGLLKENHESGYTLEPRAGRGNYDAIALLMHSLAPDPLVTKENARLRLVDNGKNSEAVKTAADLLKNYGYNLVTTTSDSNAKPGIIVYNKGNFPYTLNYLTQRYNLTTSSQKTTNEVDIDLILDQ